jgi:oxygen-independent coproporphyrinogen-3 oxidase
VAGASFDALRRVLGEIERQLQFFEEIVLPSRVETVYIGGGTPTLLSPGQLDRLLQSVHRFLAAADPAAAVSPGRGAVSEWTVEANPESLHPEHLDVCAARGVNRISLGLQSTQGGILSTLGRAAGAQECRAALELLRSRWEGQVNLDLISGAPGEDWPMLRRDLERATAQEPDHLSLYSLSLDDPDHPLARRCEPDTQDRLWLRGCRWLEERSYRNYEISNFARPGRECRHNLRYWRLEPYLGVGPGAASTLPGDAGRGEGRVAVLRLTNPRSIDAFLTGLASCWGLEVEAVDAREFLLETLMMGLRLREGIASAALAECFGRPLQELLPELWTRWAGRGLVAEPQGSDRCALSFDGRMILDRLLLEVSEAVAGIREGELSLRWG